MNMRAIAPFVVALVWSVVCAAQTPPPRDTSAQTGTAVIRGHVLDAATGQPLRRAQVRALAPELRDNRVAVTDPSGAYELKNLAAGRYSLSVSKGSYVGVTYGQARPNEPGKPLQVGNAQVVDNIDFRLSRGGVVTGHIVDEFGDPVEDVQVMAMRYQYLQGRRQLANTGRAGMTNDVGEFRIFGLPPGQYVISATDRAANINLFGDSSSGDRDRSGYAPTYYPGTANSADAQRITIGAGQKISDLTIGLLPTRLARISGTAVDSQGKPLANTMVMTMQSSSAGMMSAGGQTKADGTFTINNVAPGDYTLVILPRPAAPGAEPSTESVQASVTVNGEDIDDVRLVSVKPSKLTGRVIPAASQTNVSLSSLRLVATPANPPPLGIGSGNNPGRVNDDGTFELSVSPGKELIRMQVGGQFANTRLKSVRLNGVDVIDTGIDVRPNENIDGLEVELTTQLSSVNGVVSDTRGNAATTYTVIVFAREREKWGPGSRYVYSGRPDQEGKYKVFLPPSDYYVAALDYVEQGMQTDPDFLERLKERATEFSINEGETRNLNLKLLTGL